jgi:hypothetical protein
MFLNNLNKRSTGAESQNHFSRNQRLVKISSYCWSRHVHEVALDSPAAIVFYSGVGTPAGQEVLVLQCLCSCTYTTREQYGTRLSLEKVHSKP